MFGICSFTWKLIVSYIIISIIMLVARDYPVTFGLLFVGIVFGTMDRYSHKLKLKKINSD